MHYHAIVCNNKTNIIVCLNAVIRTVKFKLMIIIIIILLSLIIQVQRKLFSIFIRAAMRNRIVRSIHKTDIQNYASASEVLFVKFKFNSKSFKFRVKISAIKGLRAQSNFKILYHFKSFLKSSQVHH